MQKAKAEANQITPDPTIQDWPATNPYGIVSLYPSMYLLDYDTAAIYEFNMTSDAFSLVGTVYTFTPGGSWKGAGTGLDLYNDGSDNYLIATFNRYTNAGWTYTYGDSAIVQIKLGSPVTSTSAVANPNATGVVVNENYAYVTSVGGQQVAGGSADSKLEIFDLISGTPVPQADLDVNDIPAVSGYATGDYVDAAFFGAKAYVLLANYDSGWTKYDYALFQVTVDNLLAGTFGIADPLDPNRDCFYVVSSSSPAGATWGLFPGGEGELYFVNANDISTVNTAVDLSGGAITSIQNATNYKYDPVSGPTAGALNTAALVIEKTSLVPRAAGVRAATTKFARRIRPVEQERLEQERQSK